MDNNTLLNSMFIGAAIFAGFVLFWFLRIFFKKRMTPNPSNQSLAGLHQTLWEEKRKHPRVSVSWSASIETPRGLLAAQLKDISLGGAFIVCDNPLELAEKFRLTIRAATQGDLNLNAEVVWSNVNVPDDKIINRGMGVRFINNTDEARGRLNAAINAYLNENTE